MICCGGKLPGRLDDTRVAHSPFSFFLLYICLSSCNSAPGSDEDDEDDSDEDEELEDDDDSEQQPQTVRVAHRGGGKSLMPAPADSDSDESEEEEEVAVQPVRRTGGKILSMMRPPADSDSDDDVSWSGIFCRKVVAPRLCPSQSPLTPNKFCVIFSG